MGMREHRLGDPAGSVQGWRGHFGGHSAELQVCGAGCELETGVDRERGTLVEMRGTRLAVPVGCGAGGASGAVRPRVQTGERFVDGFSGDPI